MLRRGAAREACAPRPELVGARHQHASGRRIQERERVVARNDERFARALLEQAAEEQLRHRLAVRVSRHLFVCVRAYACAALLLSSKTRRREVPSSDRYKKLCPPCTGLCVVVNHTRQARECDRRN